MNTEAREEYYKTIGTIEFLLTRIEYHITQKGDNLPHEDREQLNWADVGTMKAVAEDLENIRSQYNF